jgi:Disulphide bond corrector protein DsbC
MRTKLFSALTILFLAGAMAEAQAQPQPGTPALPGAALAQEEAAAGDTVSWTLSTSAADVTPGGTLLLTLHGNVQSGWHVYGLKQLPEGPTPLRVALEVNPTATLQGALKASPPVQIHDPSFDLTTQYYARGFTVSLPLRIAAHAATGALPVAVTFQTCNGRVCQPPKTVHLSAAVHVQANP